MIEQHSYSGDYTNRYKFNGKELDEETGYYYYGARYFNSRFSIWLSVDPLAEKFPNFNPYNYVMQNPINLIDPTGMEPEEGGGDTGKNWIGRAFDTIKGWFSSGSDYQSIPKSSGSVTVGDGNFMPINEELQVGTSWYENGNTSTVVNSTTIVNQPNVGTPFYSFIYPNDLGSWGQAGSDGKIWIGCMSCHGQNGAYNYASYNSQEAIAGNLGALALQMYMLRPLNVANGGPQFKWMRGTGGNINGFTISKNSGYGARPRFDFHKLSNTYNSKATSRMTIPKWLDGKKIPHWHRGKGNNLKYHRPWEIGPDGKRKW